MVTVRSKPRGSHAVLRLSSGLLFLTASCVSIDERKLKTPTEGGSPGSDGSVDARDDRSVIDGNARDSQSDRDADGAASEASVDGSNRDGSNTADASPACALPSAFVEDLIDDLEDGNNQIRLKEGRNGVWWVSKDELPGTGVVTSPVSDPFAAFRDGDAGLDAGQNLRALNFAGRGFSGSDHWATAGFGLVNIPPEGTARDLPDPYDGSAYAGLRFGAKGSGRISVRMLTAATQAPDFGGTCQGTDGKGTGCGDFGTDIDLHGDGNWHRYDVAFCNLTQPNWVQKNLVTTFNPRQLLGVMFTPGGMNELVAPNWDLWFDDIVFVSAKPEGGLRRRLGVTWMNGWVDPTANDLGIQGWWTTNTDNVGSTISPTQFVGSGPICVSGTTAALKTGAAADAGPQPWGVGIRLNLNQEPSGTVHPFDAIAQKITGVKYKITGMTGRQIPSEIRVDFKVFQDPADYCFKEQIAASASANLTAMFSSAKKACYDGLTAGGSPDTKKLVSIDFQVVSADIAKDYGMCISDLEAIIN